MTASSSTLPVNELTPLANTNQASSYDSPGNRIEGISSSISVHRSSSQKDVAGIDTLDERVSSPVPLEAPSGTMSINQERIAIAACFWCFFIGGWNDAITGPLLPTIQAYYNINFTVVSMLFVTGCVGCLSAAVINIYLTDRLGLGKVLFLSAMLQVFAYALLVPGFPFPVMCIAYAMNGIGNRCSTTGCPGAGAFVSPFVATQFAQRPRWSFYFLISLALAVPNAIAFLAVFRLRKQHDFMGLPDPHTTHAQTEGHTLRGTNKRKEIFGSRPVQLMAFFILIYVGVEVTIGGWIVTFAIEERGGGTSAGYISSGFFGGLTLGRVVLLWINEKIGERRVIPIYCALCIGLELFIWLVPDLIGNAVAVSIVGLFLGYGITPFYPIAMNTMGQVVSRRVLTQSIGWIASFGQAGSALFPFMTGALAQRYGVIVLQPLLVGMTVAMALLWALIPTEAEPGVI